MICNLKETPAYVFCFRLAGTYTEIYREPWDTHLHSSNLHAPWFTLGQPGLGNSPIHLQKAWGGGEIPRLRKKSI